ncbi:MAG: sulfate ABC transporter substrate-binding protein, partial [Rhodobacteraceae bacterium]|nr:sulfate ABC transporter substrate-binding protein [Paracoccaceae bacterium]
MKRLITFLGCFAVSATMVSADNMRMAVTTSFHNSGLSDSLLPAIEQDIGLKLDLLVVGTGQAIRLGKAGDVDAILVHSRSAEEAFV